MSKKSKKLTDKKAPWLKKANASTYFQTREPNKIILIVTEGQSEKLYFKSFPVLGLSVEAINLKGLSKQKLIDATEKIIKDSDKEYDVVWCVFDMDVRHGEKEFADFDNSIKSGRKKGYEIAYSNDCYDLWYYLHYQFTDQKNHRTFYYQELSKIFGINYAKEGKSLDFCNKIYSLLQSDPKASQNQAIKRAKSLYQTSKNLPYHLQNPVTLIYKLVDFLNENCRK